jgi:YcxB-like protein
MDPVDLLVSEAGLVATAKGVRTNVEWSRFLRLKEAKNHFLLYTGADLYNIVPKRGFASEEDVDRFRQLATQRIGRK